MRRAKSDAAEPASASVHRLGAQTNANTRTFAARRSRKVQPPSVTTTSTQPASSPGSPSALPPHKARSPAWRHDESQKVFRGRPSRAEPRKQGLRAVYQKWQGPEDRKGALLTARHPMLFKTLLSMFGSCSQRLQRQGYVHNECFPSLTGTNISAVAPFVLSERPAGTTTFPNGHYLIPDTNAFLTGMDLFEVESAFHDVIVLQTVLEEVKNQSAPLYNRLISLTKNADKHFYVFFNDFRLETYVTRNEGETINDRNDRAVREAVKWYGQHLQEAAKSRKGSSKYPVVVMLSDDRENLRKAKADGLQALSRMSLRHLSHVGMILTNYSVRLRIWSSQRRSAAGHGC